MHKTPSELFWCPSTRYKGILDPLRGGEFSIAGFWSEGGGSIAGFPMDVRLMHPWLEVIQLDEVGGDPIECSPIGAQYDNWIAAVATTDPEQPQQLGAGGTSPANVYLALMVITFLL